ncbi:hypothetical protein C0991_011884 [Blastosporella zonata]|nr:hypothetical protein C0991_011884 [Blastosporella zonata]
MTSSATPTRANMQHTISVCSVEHALEVAQALGDYLEGKPPSESLVGAYLYAPSRPSHTKKYDPSKAMGYSASISPLQTPPSPRRADVAVPAAFYNEDQPSTAYVAPPGRRIGIPVAAAAEVDTPTHASEVRKAGGAPSSPVMAQMEVEPMQSDKGDDKDVGCEKARSDPIAVGEDEKRNQAMLIEQCLAVIGDEKVANHLKKLAQEKLGRLLGDGTQGSVGKTEAGKYGVKNRRP